MRGIRSLPCWRLNVQELQYHFSLTFDIVVYSISSGKGQSVMNIVCRVNLKHIEFIVHYVTITPLKVTKQFTFSHLRLKCLKEHFN